MGLEILVVKHQKGNKAQSFKQVDCVAKHHVAERIPTFMGVVSTKLVETESAEVAELKKDQHSRKDT